MKLLSQTEAQTPFEVAYRAVEPSAAVERRVLRGLARIRQVAPRIVRCRITIGMRHHGSRKGDLYHVSVDLTVPGQEVAVTRTPPTQKAGDALCTAVDEAFETARLRLLELRREQRRARRAGARRERERYATLGFAA